MALEAKQLVALRRCCGKAMETFEVREEYGTQRKKIEYECDSCGRMFRDSHENPFTIRLSIRK